MDIRSEKQIRKDYWLLILSVVSWAALVLLLPRMPERIPMHWGIDGEIDRWGSKFNLVWLGALAPAIWALMTWLPNVDPRRDNYGKFNRSYRVIRVVVVLMMVAMTWIAAAASLGESADVIFFVKILVGLVFVSIGNLLTRIRPNWFTGIRTPWTLADSTVWRKTHRLGGFLLVLSGLLFILSAVFLDGPAGFWIPMGVTIAGALVDIVYSARLWKRLHGNESLPKPKAGGREDNQ